jgi:ABC-type nitrate/sulfonate/bicarbonate transport system substrate-binding protein
MRKDLGATMGSGEIDRRTLLRRAGIGASAIAFGGLLAGCGGDDGGSTSTAAAATAGAGLASAGSTIPATTVKFGMAPFGDASFYVIAMKRGWFDDVGIKIDPAPTGLQVTPDNVTSKLVTGEADIATFYGPGRIANLAKAKNIKMFGFSDTYVGTYLLASPDTGLKPVSELVAGGMPLVDAVKQVMASVKGQPVGLDSSGEHRDFLTQVFKLGGITFKDVKLTVTTDPKILALANGGKIKFASPNGAAQNVQLINEGWFPLISVNDLLKGLPAGDPRAVASIGHEGPACTDEYYAKNTETCLRFLSVMFRTIDAIQEDPLEYLADQVPYLTSVSGTKTTAKDLDTIFKANDPLIPFEDQSQYWVDLKGPRSYQTVYGAQIASATAGGVLPKGSKLTPEDAINGRETYTKLLALKKGYESAVKGAGKLDGQQATLAAAAKKQADARNYLDAYRMITAAAA